MKLSNESLMSIKYAVAKRREDGKIFKYVFYSANSLKDRKKWARRMVWILTNPTPYEAQIKVNRSCGKGKYIVASWLSGFAVAPTERAYVDRTSWGMPFVHLEFEKDNFSNLEITMHEFNRLKKMGIPEVTNE